MAKIRERGAHLVTVSADTPEQIASLREKQGLTFPMVSDPKLEIAAAWGVREQGKNAALPAAYVLGTDRIVRFVRVSTSPAKRPTILDLIAALP